MVRFLQGIALSAGMMLNSGAAFTANDVMSANIIMPGCRYLLQPETSPSDKMVYLIAAKCNGLVEGIAFAAVCTPDGAVTIDQTIRVVVKYIDGRPERQHEDFKALALEALRAAWPCKK